jgi:hypothetical protein
MEDIERKEKLARSMMQASQNRTGPSTAGAQSAPVAAGAARVAASATAASMRTRANSVSRVFHFGVSYFTIDIVI